MEMLTSDELKQIKGATLQILQEVGVHFPSDRALGIFVAHGAVVDDVNQIVRIPEDLVLEAMGNAPRSYTLSGRSPGTNLFLDGSQSYFCTDGCGVHTQDFETGEIRPSNKEDVAKMARVADYLSSIAFYWPIVSAQNFGTLTPLHELDASFNHTVKHVQTETLLGETQARQAVKTAEYINTIPEKYLCHGSSVQIAHDWGVPILGGAFGVDTEEQASWQLGRDSVYTALLTPLTGADIVVGLGLLKGSRVFDKILGEHQPEPLEYVKQKELVAILDAAANELGN